MSETKRLYAPEVTGTNDPDKFVDMLMGKRFAVSVSDAPNSKIVGRSFAVMWMKQTVKLAIMNMLCRLRDAIANDNDTDPDAPIRFRESVELGYYLENIDIDDSDIHRMKIRKSELVAKYKDKYEKSAASVCLCYYTTTRRFEKELGNYRLAYFVYGIREIRDLDKLIIAFEKKADAFSGDKKRERVKDIDEFVTRMMEQKFTAITSDGGSIIECNVKEALGNSQQREELFNGLGDVKILMKFISPEYEKKIRLGTCYKFINIHDNPIKVATQINIKYYPLLERGCLCVSYWHASEDKKCSGGFVYTLFETEEQLQKLIDGISKALEE